MAVRILYLHPSRLNDCHEDARANLGLGFTRRPRKWWGQLQEYHQVGFILSEPNPHHSEVSPRQLAPNRSAHKEWQVRIVGLSR